jgi:hypothetical protein
MRKDNNKEYNTPESELKNFNDFDSDKKGLKEEERNFLQNPDGYNLPNKKKMRFNKITKTWQDVSEEDIKDKIKHLEKIKIKSFEQIINESSIKQQTNIESLFTDLEKYISNGKKILEEKLLPIVKESQNKNNLKEIHTHLSEILDIINDRNINYKKPE